MIYILCDNTYFALDPIGYFVDEGLADEALKWLVGSSDGCYVIVEAEPYVSIDEVKKDYAQQGGVSIG
jgi:uncharacterized protein (DUF1499 family)